MSMARLLGVAVGVALLLPGAASAGPVSQVLSLADTTAAPGGTLDYSVWIFNVGDAPTTGVRTLEVTLPPGIAVQSQIGDRTWDCPGLVPGAATLTCTTSSVSVPNDTASRFSRLVLTASVDADAAGVLTARFAVTGGGAADARTVDPTLIAATPPPFGIEAFDGQVTANAAGDPFWQAGGHPYAISAAIVFNTTTRPDPNKGSTFPVEATKDIVVDLPPGVVGDPTATGDARCTLSQLSNAEGTTAKPFCPPGSQVGVTTVYSAGGRVLANPLPVFNMAPPPNVPARFGINVAGTVVLLDAELRSGGDYGLSVNVRNVSQGIAIAGATLTFWGVPAEPSHDLERACPGEQAPGDGGPSCATELPRRGFLRLPTSCPAPGTGLEVSLRIDSWADPGDWAAASFVSHDPPAFPLPPEDWGSPHGPTGCEAVPFEPSLTAAPDVARAGAPAAFAFDLRLPQDDDPDRIATADLRAATLTLPAGVRVSPSAAAGLGGCAPARIALDSPAEAACPGSSKLGTVTIETPLLEDPLAGSIYLATPDDNPFGALLSVYLVVRGPGLVVKLPGRIDAHPLTGQLTVTFDDLPQLPFAHVAIELSGGPRAALVNPPACGNYTTRAVLSSWSGRTVAVDSRFEVSRDGNGTPCAGSRFAPRLIAGVDGARAGAHSAFGLQLTRADEDEELRSLSVRLPRGLLAKVAGIPLCDDARALAGTCGEGSRIGDLLVGVGAGPNPLYLPGRIYLTGPYRGGPFGLAIVVPAVAGPFDLGVVVVRASIRVDRKTAQLRVVSDALPEVLDGIRLQIRDVRVAIDRARLMVNPTSCLTKRIAAAVVSTTGTAARLADRFQVGGCRRLALRPRLRLRVGAPGRTRARASTPLVARLTQAPGKSNIRSVGVTLPTTLSALLRVAEDACTVEQFDAGDCEQARTGRAVAVIPLLDEPLRGNVYLVKDPRGGLPNLFVALRGQVAFDLVGTIAVVRGGRLAARFRRIPDVPIRSFTLRMAAGASGSLGVARDLCSPTARRARARVIMRGHNGLVVRRTQRLKVDGCGPARGRPARSSM